jgi:diketogulonate reductase-like aldo/keto reductase
VIAIPKSSHEKRVLENAAAANLVLDDEDLAGLDAIFPPPRKKRPLAIT